jgi:hypothetical protein
LGLDFEIATQEYVTEALLVDPKAKRNKWHLVLLILLVHMGFLAESTTWNGI